MLLAALFVLGVVAAGRWDDAVIGNCAVSYAPASGSPFTSLFGPVVIVSADFDGDGRADLAILQTDGDAHVRRGNGDGTFTAVPGPPFATGSNAAGMAVGDYVVAAGEQGGREEGGRFIVERLTTSR